jgi:uracil-DNA glycosylase family 4
MIHASSLAELEGEIRRCTQCRIKLGDFGVVPKPIFAGHAGAPVFLLGQAPGRTEYEKGRPFQGEAGASIKALFVKCGLQNFDEVVYQTGVTKCFPERKPGASSDRLPSRQEVVNCFPFLLPQLALVQPRLLVCLGSLSWRAVLSLIESEQPGFCAREVGVATPAAARVSHLVGRRFAWRSMIVLPMIHPAGSANGARAKYPEADKASKELLGIAFAEIGVTL